MPIGIPRLVGAPAPCGIPELEVLDALAQRGLRDVEQPLALLHRPEPRRRPTERRRLQRNTHPAYNMQQRGCAHMATTGLARNRNVGVRSTTAHAARRVSTQAEKLDSGLVI